MRLALLTTMAAVVLTVGGCAVHPMMPMRMAHAHGEAAGTCPAAEAGAAMPGHGPNGLHGMQGMHGMHAAPGAAGGHGMHAMHGRHHAPGAPHADCPAAQAAEPRR